MTGTCALRALKRKISDAIYARLVAEERSARTASGKDPAGQPGNDSVCRGAAHTPKHQLFGQATPGPLPSLEPQAHRHSLPDLRRHPDTPLDTKRPRSARRRRRVIAAQTGRSRMAARVVVSPRSPGRFTEPVLRNCRPRARLERGPWALGVPLAVRLPAPVSGSLRDEDEQRSDVMTVTGWLEVESQTPQQDQRPRIAGRGMCANLTGL